EGIEADEETLGVITLAGEGSVRDSLSALDQAIACCGQKLVAAEVRDLLGRFSIDTLVRVAEALLAGESGRMLDLVQELERNGQNVQHFSRELCRFFRNLLVTKISGSDTRLVAAAGGERAKLGEMASKFSEEDLTRYLHLTLEVFQELQESMQPRMHLELGLVKMVHAGRLRSIEEILAGAPAPQSPAPRTAPPKAPAPVPPPPATASASGMKQRLLDVLNQKGMSFIADAVEHSNVVEKPGELEFATTKEFALAVRSSDMQK